MGPWLYHSYNYHQIVLYLHFLEYLESTETEIRGFTKLRPIGVLIRYRISLQYSLFVYVVTVYRIK